MRFETQNLRFQNKRTLYSMVPSRFDDPKFRHDQCIANLRSENIGLKQSLYDLASQVDYAIEIGCLSANPILLQRIDRILDIVELQLQD